MKSARNFLTIAMSLLLVNCSIRIPDTAFLNGQNSFDKDYVPDGKMLGKWMMFTSNSVGYSATLKEQRSDYEFLNGGGGRIREVSQFHATGNRIVLEAPLRWKRLSQNTWKVSLPTSDHYRVVSAEKAHISGSRPAREFVMRSGNGRLYDIDNLKTLVPLNQAKAYIDEVRARVQNREATTFVVGF